MSQDVLNDDSSEVLVVFGWQVAPHFQCHQEVDLVGWCFCEEV